MTTICSGEFIRKLVNLNKHQAITFALALGIALLRVDPAHAAIGRLFFTPAQRAQMDAGVQQSRVQPIKITGMVQQDGGVRTLWVNGVATRAGKTSPIPVSQVTRSIVIRRHD